MSHPVMYSEVAPMVTGQSLGVQNAGLRNPTSSSVRAIVLVQPHSSLPPSGVACDPERLGIGTCRAA